jgi:general secretion pathway protein A
VEQAAREVFGTAAPARRGWPVALTALAGLGAVAALGAWSWQRQGATAPAAVALAPSAPATAASAPASAPAAVTAAAPAALLSDDPAALLAAARADEDTAWRELALRWNVAIGEGEPCQAAAQALLACFRSPHGGLPLVRQLARPGLLSLRGPAGSPAHALLVALTDRQATLQVGARRFDLTLPALASVWRGDYATFWRTPPGWRASTDEAADPRARGWVEQQLAAALPAATSASLRDRVAIFQLVQGLPADGRAGPMTLMALNRAAGVAEPWLEVGR